MSNEKRILVTLVLTIAVLFVYETFIFGPQQDAKKLEVERKRLAAQKLEEEANKKTEPAQPEIKQKAEVAAAADSSKTAAETGDAAKAENPPTQPEVEEPVEAIPLHSVVIDTPLWTARLSNRGAVLESFTLKNYYSDEDKKKPKELIKWKKIPYAPLASTFGEDILAPDTMYTFEQPSEYTVVFRASNKALEIEKKYIFEKDRHYFELNTSIKSKADVPMKGDFSYWLSRYQGESVKKSGGWFSPPKFKLEAMCYTKEDSLDTITYKDLDPSGLLRKDPLWTGISEQYFITAIIPSMKSEIKYSTECISERGESRHLQNLLTWRDVRLNPGEALTFETTVFAGPKKMDLLENLGAELEKSIDWGILGVICRPMLFLMNFFFSLLGNWGLAIIFLTLVVKALLFPVTHKSFKSMREMQNLKPEIDKLKISCAGDKERLNREMMDIYKKHGVNPLGGCLPMLIQMPIWFALYRTLYSAVDIYQAPFISGWLDDLASPDPYYILPIGLGIVTFAQQLISPTAMDNAQAKMMKYFMPPFFAVIMLNLPSGLTLYIFVNSILSIIQQTIINRSFPPPNAAAVTADVKSNGGKKSGRKRK